jgi:hypothetical protein
MDGMIEDLVDSARNESHRLQLQVGPVDVGAYLAELLDRSVLALMSAGIWTGRRLHWISVSRP